jgi:CRP-like cAMP-binding protein
MTVVELEGFQELEGADRLQKIPIFRGLSYDETNALAGLIRRQVAQPGAVLVEQNALGSALFLLTSGTVRVERHGDDGKVTEVLGHLGPGQMFGEMALIDDLLTSACVVAETAVDLLAVDRAPFEKLLEQNERLAFKVYRAFCRQLSERLRKTNDLLAGKAGLLGHSH